MTEEARLDITLRFWLPPSAEHFEGRLQRFTSRLVIFRTRTRVPVGAAIRFSVCTAQSGNVSCTHPLPARAERVERAGEDYEVAAAFHAADNIMKQDKRRQIRHSVDLTGRFWRTTARVPFTCRIRDISPNGARFIVEGALLRFEKIRLEIDPPASGLFRKIIRAEFQVCRCRHLGRGIYEAGGRFLRIETEKSDAPAEPPAGPRIPTKWRDSGENIPPSPS